MLMAELPGPRDNDHQLMAGAPPFPAGSHVTLANWQDPPFNRWAFHHSDHASGINGQNVFVHVPTRTVVAKFSTWPTALSSKIKVTTDGARAIAEKLGGGLS